MSGDELRRGPRHDVKGRMTKTSEISKRKGNRTCVGKSDIGDNDRGPTNEIRVRKGDEGCRKASEVVGEWWNSVGKAWDVTMPCYASNHPRKMYVSIQNHIVCCQINVLNPVDLSLQ